MSLIAESESAKRHARRATPSSKLGRGEGSTLAVGSPKIVDDLNHFSSKPISPHLDLAGRELWTGQNTTGRS
jgi:hypothetical protein